MPAKKLASKSPGASRVRAPKATPRPAQHPPISTLMIDRGGLYAGILRGETGEPDYRLYLAPEPKDLSLPWAKAMSYAKAFKSSALHDFTLPTRREQRLLWANLPEHFDSAWYWSNEQYAGYSDYAWMQNFGNGNQYIVLKSLSYRVRLVRRVPIR